MKKININILILLLFFSKQIIAQNNTIISGTYRANTKIIIHVYEPLNGYFNMSFVDSKTENSSLSQATDSFFYKTTITEPASFLVYITTDEKVFVTRSVLILFPGDSVNLQVDLINNDKESITYKGSNSLGQKLFNDINYNPIYKYQKVIDRLNTLNSNKENLTKDIDLCIKYLLTGFDSLATQSLITPQFKSYIRIMLTQLIYDFTISKFLRNYKQREALTRNERDSIIDYFFKKLPITDPYLKSTFNSYFYQIHYYNYLAYKKHNLFSIEPLYADKTVTYNGKSYIISNECGQFFFIDDSTIRADLWALFVLDMMNMTPRDYFTKTIKQFNEMFANSKWNTIFDNQMERLRTVRRIHYKLQSPIYFVDSTKNHKTLQSVLKDLPSDSSVFIDIWASWCGPCIKTFEYNNQLDTFLIINNIKRLYVSLDYKGTEKTWISAIKKYALGGYHVLANDSLISDIKETCDIVSNEGLGIPRYMLVDKDKQIILNSAVSPENMGVLKDQIIEYLVNSKAK